MISLSLAGASGPVERVVAIGCHADDIEIGCGGTFLTLTRALPVLEVTWIILTADATREQEARASADAFLGAATSVVVEVYDFRDGFLPYSGAGVKEAFADLGRRLEPQLVFTHTREDLHQDHRLACELTWNTFRNCVILEYEVPKFDGDLGRPNLFVPLRAAVAEEKIELLHRHFPTQTDNHWFDADTFRGLMRLRGIEVNADERFAEAFVCRKLPIAP